MNKIIIALGLALAAATGAFAQPEFNYDSLPGSSYGAAYHSAGENRIGPQMPASTMRQPRRSATARSQQWIRKTASAISATKAQHDRIRPATSRRHDPIPDTISKTNI